MTPVEMQAVMERLNLTQLALAERLGCSRDAVKRWLSCAEWGRPIPPWVVKRLREWEHELFAGKS